MQDQVAIKFFIDRHAFDIEQHLFSLEPLKASFVAPTAWCTNVDGAVRSPQGYIFPPHTVADVGEPLETWMAGENAADFITCIQVRSSVLQVVIWNRLWWPLAPLPTPLVQALKHIHLTGVSYFCQNSKVRCDNCLE